jgi:hypothetical protein
MLDSPFEKSLIKHDPGFCVLIVVFVFVLAYGFCGCVSQPLNQNSDKSNPDRKALASGLSERHEFHRRWSGPEK